MTVLSKYQRLECDGVWQASAQAQRRDVFVSLGEATLVINDANDTALTHWSLPAVERINPGATPALYRPGTDADEVLELADETMIDAIRTVQKALIRTKPRPGRLRRTVLIASAAAILALGVWWLPEALVRHTASVLPPTVRAEIGQRLLRTLQPYSGSTCTAAQGLVAMSRLRRTVLTDPGWNVVVIQDGPRTSAHLPGRLIVLRRDLIDRARGPEAAAGAMLVEASRARSQDPMLALLRSAGSGATLGLLTRGEIGRVDLERYAAQVLVAPRAEIRPGMLEEMLAATGIPLTPYLRLAEPPDDGLAPSPQGALASVLLDDAGWQRLRSICEE